MRMPQKLTLLAQLLVFWAACGDSTTDTVDGSTTVDSEAATSSAETETSTTGPLDSCPSGMVLIQGGSFVDGGFLEERHDVENFCMDLLEVTVEEYAACVDAGACDSIPEEYSYANLPTSQRDYNWGAPGRGLHPINGVSWDNANDYCAWVSKRLPDEWEWEWAARGRDEGRTYPWGEQKPTCEYAVMVDEDYGCGLDSTNPVGTKSPQGDSRDGVRNMGGNVTEWTSSVYESTTFYTVRGGHWSTSESTLFSVFFRIGAGRNNSDYAQGFRCTKG